MRKISYIMMAVSLMAVCGCIRNDIPYPTIHANFTSISAVGQSEPAVIDSVNRIVNLYFNEDANIYKVEIAQYTLTPGAKITKGDLDGQIDLSTPYQVVVSLYQDYDWSIKAIQEINRQFTVEGQIGQSIIDTEAHTVTAFVSKAIALDAVQVNECKLGPTSSEANPDLNGKIVDFSKPLTIKIENYGHTEVWTINVEHADTPAETLSVDAWTCVAWVYAEGETGKHNTVEYRIKGDTGWITVPDEWITADGGSYHARITGLTPQTTYETRAVSGSDYGETLEFTTGANVQMPNSNFDEWWLDGKVWDPWPENGTPYWDTGNKGAATLGQSNSVPTDDTVDGHGHAAMLQTKFIGIGFLGKLGAGNIFTGSYLRTEGTNGVLSFGREFKERPTRLKGYMKYKTAPISSVTAGFEDWKGRPDTCNIWIALVDLDAPLEIRTNPSDRQLFEPDADYVVAYGNIQSGSDIEEYMPFDITLNYRSTSRVPKYIIVAASASKYGDYFTGGNGAVLFVDNFELGYDY